MREFINALDSKNEQVSEPIDEAVIEEDIDGDASSFDMIRKDFGNITILDFKYDGDDAGQAILRRNGDDWLNVQVDIAPQFEGRRFDLFALRKAAEIADAEDRALKKTISLPGM